MMRSILFVLVAVGVCSVGFAAGPPADEVSVDEVSAEQEPVGEAWSLEERGPERESVVDSLTEKQKLWVLATCAVITEINHGRHDILGGGERTEENIERERSYLKESWGADSSEDVLAWLEWFRHKGSRKEFEDLGAQISSLTPEQMESLREQMEGHPGLKNKVEVLEAHYEALGEKSLKGWDAARCVAMCGWAYVAGYLTEEEAWEHMLPAARFLQKTLDSWRDLGDNYLIGNQFFIAEQLDKSTDPTWYIIEKLCTEPDSPWVKLPWDLDLGGSSDGDEEQEQTKDEAMLEFYRTQSVWTDPGEYEAMYAGIPDDVGAIVEAVQGVVVPSLVWLYDLEPSEAQQEGSIIRRTDELLARIKALDSAGLDVKRPPEKLLEVCCRQFAVLTCSILRHKGIPARARAGYALYTWRHGKYENHWICEYWNEDEKRWIQVDAQIDAKQREIMKIDFDTLDMPPGRFVVAGEGWRLFRDGDVPPENFGVGGGDVWHALGWRMAMENVTCDMLALNKVELLPWDVPPFARKTEDEMSPEDMALIEQAAQLTVEVNTRWADMRAFYDSHPAFHMPEGFEDDKQAEGTEE